MSNDFRAEIDVSVKGVDSITAAQKATTDLDAALLKAADSAQKMDSSLKNTAKGASEMGKSSAKVTAGLSATGEAADSVGAKAKKSGDDMEASWRKQHDSLSNTRYALYDVAAMYGTVSVAATAVSAATVGVAASYEKSFANVARTTMATGEELEKIRTELVGLSQVTPISYNDITAVASLGAQLGIANNNLSGFTQTVTQFAATTDVTVERTAMALGRIAQLTGTAGSEIDNLASTIYFTGINAVATEGQILGVAEQIATTGNLAGFTNHEIIALSSALASLGVAPEAARGSFMRIFQNIRTSVDEGGAALERFAQISGTSAQHVQENWGTNSQQVFTEFIQGMERMAQSGQNVDAVLKDMGIYQVRDINAIKLLLNNTEVYLQAQTDTAQAYKENSALSEGFALQTNTLVDALLRLKNNFMAITAEGSGFNDVLKGAINVLNSVLKVIADISQHPIGRFFVGATAAVALAVTAWASFHVAVNLARGGLAAYATAQAGLMKSNINLKIGLVQVTRELFALATGGDAATKRLLTTGSAMNMTSANAKHAAVSVRGFNASLTNTRNLAGLVGQQAKSMGASLASSIAGFAKQGLIVGGVSLAIAGAAKAWDVYSESQKSAGQKATEFFGGTGSLVEAMIKDTEAGDASLRTMVFSVEQNSTALNRWGSELQKAAGDQVQLGDAAYSTSTEFEKQVVLLGKLSEAAILDLVIQETTAAWIENGEALTAVGFSIEEYLSRAAKMDGSAEAYLAGFPETILVLADLKDAAFEARTELDVLMNSGVTSGGEFDRLSNNLKVAQDALDQFVDVDMSNYEAADKAIGKFAEAVGHVPGAVSEASREVEIASAKSSILGVDLDEAGDGAAGLAGEMDTLADKVKEFNSAISSDIAAADMFYSMGEALHKNGLEFDLFTQGGIANMQLLEQNINAMAVAAGDDSNMFIGNVLEMMSALEAQGVQVGSEFDWVYQQLNALIAPEYGINLSTAAARQNAINLINDLIAVERQIMAMNQIKYTKNPFLDPSRASTPNFVEIPDNTAKLNGLISLQKSLTKAVDQSVPAASNLARGYDNAARNANSTGKGAGKAAKNTKDAAKAAKELAKNTRTSDDYAKDLAGVFGDINDLVFGMSNATGQVRENFKDLLDDLAKDASAVRLDIFGFDRQEALDGILSTFHNLKQAAADAKIEVRDSLAAVQDAQAKLQTNKAEGATLEYQLMVAKALGSAERIAEIEAKIAENQAARVESTNDVADALERQRKAQANTSTSTTGDAEKAIENRDAIRKLASEYMDYADTLRDAGLSTTDVAKYTKQAEKDFLAQGKALGFSDAQLKVFSQGILKSSGEIKKNSTDLKTNEKALEDLYLSHVDAVTAFAATGASQKQVAAFAKESEKQFNSQAKQLGFNITELGKFNTAWDALHKTIKALPSAVTIKSNVANPSDAALRKFFTEWNNKKLNLKTSVDAKPANDWKTKNTGGKGLSNPIKTKVTVSVDKTGANRAATLAGMVANLQTAIQAHANALKSGNTSAAARAVQGITQLKTQIARFDKGGFTGRGGKLEEAGVVHKGEYVFTQAQVNQSTGQPKPEALYAMLGKTMGLQQPSVRGEAMAYNPSPVNSNPLTLVELLPNQMSQLARMIGSQMPSPPSLSDTTLAVNQINASRTGRGQG